MCRGRKVRCDRLQPCSACVRHKSQHLCSYDVVMPYLQSGPSSQEQKPPSLHTDTHYAISSNFEPRSHAADPLRELYLAPNTAAHVLSSFSHLDQAIGVNPTGPPSEKINFYANYCLISTDAETLDECNHAPFSWHLTVRTDPALSQIWGFLLNNRRPDRDDRPGNDQKANSSGARLLDRIRKHLVSKFSPSSIGRSGRLTLGLTYRDPTAGRADATPAERFGAILPPRDVVWLHVDRFFRVLYPFFPFLDERTFRTQIEELLGEKRPEAAQIRPTNGSSSSIDRPIAWSPQAALVLALLCVVMRLSYLALLSNDMLENHRNLDGTDKNLELLRNPVGIECVEFARTMVSLSISVIDGAATVPGQCNLLTVQLMLMLREYLEVAPERVDGPGRDVYRVNNGALLQMAYHVGLNREPSLRPGAIERDNYLRRKLWLRIQYRDVLNAVKFGLPFALLTEFCDTNFPNYLDGAQPAAGPAPPINSMLPTSGVYALGGSALPGPSAGDKAELAPEHGDEVAESLQNGNCLTPGNDAAVQAAWAPLERFLPLLRLVLAQALQVREGVELGSLVQGLNEIETFLAANFGSFREFSDAYRRSDAASVAHFLKLEWFIPAQVFLLQVYFRLFRYYEVSRRPDLSYFYCKKLISVVAQDFLPNALDLVYCQHPHFGHAAHLVANPQLEYIFHRGLGFLNSWILRLGHHIVSSQSENSGSLSVDISREKFLMRALARTSKCLLLGIHKLNHRYCYAWRIATTFTYIHRALISEEFYQINRAALPLMPRLDLLPEQITSLVDIMEPLILHTDLALFPMYMSLVNEVIKPGGTVFNPMESKIVFAGLPQKIDDLDTDALDMGPFDPQQFPMLAHNSDLSNVMGLFFDGPESYFEALSTVNGFEGFMG